MLEENNLHVLIVGAHLPNTLGPERVCISKIFQLAMHRIVTNFLFQVNFRHDKRVATTQLCTMHCLKCDVAQVFTADSRNLLGQSQTVCHVQYTQNKTVLA